MNNTEGLSMPSPGTKGTCAHGFKNKREKIDRRPPWTTGRYKDQRKDTKLMRQVKLSVEVRESTVHGKGVFATEVIPGAQKNRLVPWTYIQLLSSRQII